MARAEWAKPSKQFHGFGRRPHEIRLSSGSELAIPVISNSAVGKICILWSLRKLRRLEMSNPMKYIKDLEAAGFQRNQAEAQVQMVLDAIEGDLVTKSEFISFRQHVDHRFNELELRLVVKLSLVIVSTATIAIAVLSWLIKLH
jgi:hypothetical protein